MRAMLRAFALVLAFGLAAAGPRAEAATPAPVILVLIDGFRADYLDRGETPTLAALASGGARAKALRPSFPSVSLPNHTTLVTGVRPDRHGMIYNVMEDPLIPGQVYGSAEGHARDVMERDPRWWSDATPIWVVAEKQGVRTAPLFWVGSSVKIQGVQGSEWSDYPRDLPPPARVDAVLARLDLPPARRPRLVTLYFGDVDTAGHIYGPDTPEVNAALRVVDAAMRRLVDGLKARGLDGKVNLVVVADHGMASTGRDRIVYVEDHVDAAAVRVIGGPVAGVYPAPGREAEVEAKLLGRRTAMECWRKADVPARLHYGTHRRVPPIVCLGDVGWMVLSRAQEKTLIAGMKGVHGWDPAAPEMAALFVANGPAFRPGAMLETMDNVDVYPLVAHLIGIRPGPSQGDLSRLKPILR